MTKPQNTALKNEPSSIAQTEADELLAKKKDPSIFSEFWNFFSTSRKWWILPLLIFFILIGFFLGLVQTGVAPFIYVLF